MSASEILQLALQLSAFVRDLMGRLPREELTEEQRQILEQERAALNAQWERLAPPPN